MKHQRLVGISVFVAFAVLGIARVAEAAVDAPGKNDALLGTFRIPKNGEAIVLPLIVGKEEVLFQFDTGASWNAFDESLKSVLGQFVETRIARTQGNNAAVNTYEPPVVRLGQLKLPMGAAVAAVDLSGGRRVVGRDIRGILGMETLKHFIVQVDCDNGQLRFYSSMMQPDSEWGVPIPTHAEAGCPTISIDIADVSAPFLIDTGAGSMIILEGELIRKLRISHRLGVTAGTAPAMTLGGHVNSLTCTMRTFSVGPFEHKNVVCHQGNRNLLGLLYLSRYQVTFDFPRHTMYLKKGARYQAAEHADMSGLHILREEGNAIVRIVDAESPGDRAGIKPGDRILRIDGQESANVGMFDLRNILKSGDGKKIRLTIARGEKEEDKVVELKEAVPQW